MKSFSDDLRKNEGKSDKNFFVLNNNNNVI